jgi:aryl-alcohol dehydrogenase-like predicted oxidoreductase
MIYNRSGRSGLKLPAISLGLWHNFGFDKSADSMRAICRQALDLGVTYFDLANNYGPPPGSAELASGGILRGDFRSFRDELVILSSFLLVFSHRVRSSAAAKIIQDGSAQFIYACFAARVPKKG